MSPTILIETIFADSVVLILTLFFGLIVIGFTDSGVRPTRSLTMAVFVPVIPLAAIGCWLSFVPRMVVQIHPASRAAINAHALEQWGVASFGLAAICLFSVCAVLWPSLWAASKQRKS